MDHLVLGVLSVAALEYRVVAIDRPGYGALHGLLGDRVRLADLATRA
jgi:pimeloyl-ACP methyl ester carboxylesterase